jgi:hypothetical protein
MGGYAATAGRSGQSLCRQCVLNELTGPHVDDDSEWYVVDDAECPGQGLIELNPEPVVVPTSKLLATRTDVLQLP